jgi:hypothetical protein
MINFQLWPPPDWTECVVAWNYLIDSPWHPRELYQWCNDHKSSGRYHVHGWQSTEGFAFRFEDPYDAIVFKLRWKCE